MGECNKYSSAQARPKLLVSCSTSFICFSSCSRLSQIAIVRDHVWRLYQCVANVSWWCQAGRSVVIIIYRRAYSTVEIQTVVCLCCNELAKACVLIPPR